MVVQWFHITLPISRVYVYVCHWRRLGSRCLRDLRFVFGWFRFRFSLVKEHLIEFTQLAMANSEGSDDMLNRVMPKDNIGLAALLKTKEAAWDNGELTCVPMRCPVYRKIPKIFRIPTYFFLQ